MITLSQFQSLLADYFFEGADVIAGIVIYVVILAIIFVLSKRNMTTALIIGLPVTFIFSLMGILTNDMMILMIIVSVLGLAYTTRDIWRN